LECRKLTSIIILALFLVYMFLPTKPVFANGFQVKTDKDNYYPGSTLTITVSGATANRVVAIQVNDPSNNVRFVYQLTASSTGSGSVSITIPMDWPIGTYTVYAKDDYTGNLVTCQFNIIALPKVSSILLAANVTNVLAGGAVGFTATVKDQYGNVMAGVDVDLLVDGVRYATRTTGSDGKALFTVVFNNAGTFSVYASSAGVSSNIVTITVAKVPPALTSITLSANATSIIQYKTIMFSAVALDQYGFGMAGVTLDLYVNGVKVDSKVSDSSGTATFKYTFNDFGSFTVYVASGAVKSPTITITVSKYVPPPVVTSVSISVDRTKINTGESVTVTVVVKDQYGNVMANRKVELYVDGTKQLEGYTNSDGKAVFPYQINVAGSYKFKAVCEGVSSTEVTVTVEAPPAPPVPTWSYTIIIPVVVLIVVLVIIIILSRRF